MSVEPHHTSRERLIEMSAHAARLVTAALTALASVLLFAAPATASLRLPFGDENYYAGARWDNVPAPSIGASASLRLDGGLSGDRVSGGHVAQMLWVNTNNPLSRDQRRNGFAGAAAVPYIATGISENRAGALRLGVFVAQRNVRGEYFETYAPRSVKRGQTISVAIQCAADRGCNAKYNKGGDDSWQVYVSGTGRHLNLKDAGARPGSSAMYAGLAATNKGSSAFGRVSDLGWIIGAPLVFPHPSGWFLNTKRFTPVIAGRGVARARWDEKFVSLSNALNRSLP